MRAGTIALACAVAALAASGCGSDQKAAPKAKQAATGKSEPEATATPQAPARPAIDGEGVRNGWRFRFTIDELKRSGPTVIVNAKVQLLNGDDDDGWQISDTFNDGDYQKLDDGGSETGHVFDGIALIDPVGRKKYLVARDSDGNCVCSNNLSDTFVYGSTPVTLQATLTAPPPGVKKIDVVVPRVKTFHDVALTD
jgi:hypothetical protein